MKRRWLAYGTWKGYQLVDQIQAGNFFVPRTILDHLTPVFDEQLFPFMAEEMDFSLRLRQAGYQILYVPQAKINHYFLRLGYRSFILYSAFWYGRASVIFNKRNQHILGVLRKFGKTIAQTMKQKKKTFLWGFLHDGHSLFRAKYAKHMPYNVVFYGIALSYLVFLWIGSVYGTIEYVWIQKKK
jgi:GT2 family glycosyltransferase